MSYAALVILFADIVAKGIGVIAIIFAAGMLLGVVLALAVLRRLRR